MRTIYLDYNATTPVAPTVQEAMLPFLTEHYGNPSSHHWLGRACQEAVEDSRAHLASLLRCEPEEMIFTSCGTESNNLAIKGIMLQGFPGEVGHLIISALEHPAVVAPARFLERLGFDVTVVPCDQNGVVDPSEIEAAIRAETRLVSVMHANNEIGTIQPIRQIAEICHAHDVLIHTDAAQSVGKMWVVPDELEVDLLTVVGHKMYAPKGIGALYVRRGIALEPVIHGAGHEEGVRSGTENVASIVGLGQAANLAIKGIDEMFDRMTILRDRLMNTLRDTIGDELIVFGEEASRLPNTLGVAFSGVLGGAMLERIPEICASTGAACHSGSAAVSDTLQAIGIKPEVAAGSVRLSIGWYTSEEDIDRAASLLIAAWEDLHT